MPAKVEWQDNRMHLEEGWRKRFVLSPGDRDRQEGLIYRDQIY